MARKTKEELEVLKNQYNVHYLFSWSRINTFLRDKYEYFLKYIKQVPEDRKDSIYAVLGSVVHQCIENMYELHWSNEAMLEYYEEQSNLFETAGYMFDRNDKDKNYKIANKYHECNHHFLKHYQKNQNHKILIEEFIPIMIGKFLFQGYIDMIQIDEKNNKLTIIDFKTSSLYKGEKVEQKKGQLLLYVLGIIQKGWKLEDIQAGWVFTKYVKATYQQKNGKMNTRIIERNQLAEKLKNVVLMMLKDNNYNFAQSSHYMKEMLLTNSLSVLPQEIINKIKIEDCFVEIDLQQENLLEFQNDLIKTIREIVALEEEYKQTDNESLWYQEVTDAQSYFMAVLSGYSRKNHKPYDDYLKKLEEQELKNNEENDPELDNLLAELGL